MNATTIKTAARRVTARRKKIGISQAEAARRTGISQPTWSLYESGKDQPSWDVLRRMAKAVGMRVTITVEDES